jgi:hypothetical protein
MRLPDAGPNRMDFSTAAPLFTRLIDCHTHLFIRGPSPEFGAPTGRGYEKHSRAADHSSVCAHAGEDVTICPPSLPPRPQRRKGSPLGVRSIGTPDSSHNRQLPCRPPPGRYRPISDRDDVLAHIPAAQGKAQGPYIHLSRDMRRAGPPGPGGDHVDCFCEDSLSLPFSPRPPIATVSQPEARPCTQSGRREKTVQSAPCGCRIPYAPCPPTIGVRS